MELRDDEILLKSEGNIGDLRNFFKLHVKKLQALNTKSPKLGELKGISLEEEFE